MTTKTTRKTSDKFMMYIDDEANQATRTKTTTLCRKTGARPLSVVYIWLCAKQVYNDHNRGGAFIDMSKWPYHVECVWPTSRCDDEDDELDDDDDDSGFDV